MRQPLVVTTKLRKSYRSGATLIRAVSDVSIRIEKGEYVAICGRSGSGKSSLMSLLGLLDRPDSGSYSLDGRDTLRLGEAARAAARGDSIGFVFQLPALLARASAIENVELPLVYAGVRSAERRRRAERALQRVGLRPRAHHMPQELSGGEQQRVSIARAVVNDPLLLLADEPTGALDSRTADEILTLFDELNQQGCTICVVTHAPEVARRAQRRITLDDGRVSDDDGRMAVGQPCDLERA
jgi:putative ABC transport system ATP-binding protein